MKGELRVATPEDASGIVELIQVGVKERAFHQREPSVEGYTEFAFDDPPKGFYVFVYQIGKEIAGYVDVVAGKRGVGEIYGICVRPEYRRKGIAKNLFNKVMETFTENGCHKATLKVFADNKGAIDFYKSQNFIQEGYLQKDEEKKDAIIMSRFLE
ncbi:MAG: N-acetyltransferase family protein [Candidatus Thorarchaeota archaeon]|jgi:ribosomal protein S18 acetylase RimI-like enzyme